MSGFRLAPEAEAELDDIWLYIARATGNIEFATRMVEKITEHFWLLAKHPYIGRARDEDWRPGLRSLVADDYLIIHRIVEDDLVLILHVVRGSRNIVQMLRS